MLDQIHEDLGVFNDALLSKAQEFLQGNIHRRMTLDGPREGIIEVPWCGGEPCGLEMERVLDMKTLGTPIPPETCKGTCPVCGKKAATWVRLANTY